MDQIYGNWIQDSCDNVDAFLSAIGQYYPCVDDPATQFIKAILIDVGIGWALRTAAKTQTPTVEFSASDDGLITFKTITTFKTDEQKFKLGEEYLETRMDNKSVKTVPSIKDGGLVLEKDGDKQKYTVTFVADGGKLTCIYKAGDVKATRIFKQK